MSRVNLKNQQKMKLRFVVLMLALPFLTLGATGGKKNIKKKKAKAAAAKKKAAPAESPYRVVIDKSDFELRVYDKDGWLSTYPIVFGSENQGDKKMQGDRLTPEGTFRIISKRTPHKWQAIMLLDYPNKESLEKFNRRKANGEVPANASPGNGIAIHGTWPGSDWVVDNYVNWTEGCISLKNSDVEELFKMLPTGTRVTIQK